MRLLLCAVALLPFIVTQEVCDFSSSRYNPWTNDERKLWCNNRVAPLVTEIHLPYHDGSEVMFSIGGVKITTKNTDENLFFNAFDFYVKKLKSWHDVTITYEATHVGANTTYHTITNTQGVKGWTGVLNTADILNFFYEGDLEACSHITQKSLQLQGASNERCAKDDAKEYCHRHGGELLLPDDVSFDYMLGGMCNPSMAIGDFFSDNADAFIPISANDYWVDVERIKVGTTAAGVPQFNHKTNARFHIFHLFLHSNVFTGFERQGVTRTANRDNRWQWILRHVNQIGTSVTIGTGYRTINPTGNVPTDILGYTPSQMEDEAVEKFELFHKRLYDDEVNPVTTAIGVAVTWPILAKALGALYDRTLSATSRATGQHTLNMNNFRKALEDGSYEWSSSACAVFRCDSNNKLKSLEATDCHINDVRPFCVNERTFDVKMICPLQMSPQVNYCGPTVPPLMITTVYGHPVVYNHQIRDSGLGSTVGGAVKSNVINYLNRIIDSQLSAIRKTMPTTDPAVAGGTKTTGVADYRRALYMDCRTANPAIDGWDWNNPGRVKSYLRTICESGGFASVPTTHNSVANVQNVKYAFTPRPTLANTNWCTCTCPSPLTFRFTASTTTQCDVAQAAPNDGLPLNLGRTLCPTERPIGATSQTESARYKHCCPAGHAFVSDDGYNYIIADNGRCGISECKDRSVVSGDEHFWSSTAQLNTGKGWYDTWTTLNGAARAPHQYHEDAWVHATCIPATCNIPVCPPSTTMNMAAVAGKTKWALGEIFGDCVCDTSIYCGNSRSVCGAPTSGLGRDAGVWRFDSTRLWSACTGRTCSVPLVHENGILSAVAGTSINRGTSVVASCKAGFMLANNDLEGAIIAGGSGTIPCAVSANAQCTTPLTNPFKCVPIQCIDPCKRGDIFETVASASGQRFDIGDKVSCSCRFGTESTGSLCESVCSASGVFINTCTCGVPSCPAPCDIPNGKVYHAGTDVSKLSRFVNTIYISGNIEPGRFVNYRCDPGFRLYHTATGKPTELASCARQCFMPPNESDAHGVAHTWTQGTPILDPVACYCAPIPCAAHVMVGNSHNYVDAAHAAITHWPWENFNYLCMKCKDGTFSDEWGTNFHDCVTCSVDCTTGNVGGQYTYDPARCQTTWTRQGTCTQPSCPDPRGVYGAQVEPKAAGASYTMNLDHTCSSLDAIQLQPNSTWLNLASGNVINNNLVRFVDDREPQFIGDASWTPNTYSYSNYLDLHAGGAGGQFRRMKKREYNNVVEGSKMRFTCMKGFKPYFNWDNAVDAQNFGSTPGNSFYCTCKDGRWCCTHHCRCEEMCPKPEPCYNCNK